MPTSPSPTTPHSKHWDTSRVRVYLPACPAHTLACPERALLHTNARFLRTRSCALSHAITFSSTPSALTAHFRCLRAVPRVRLLHGARSTSTRTRTSLPRHFVAQWRFSASSPRALFTRNRCFHAFSLPPSSPVGEPVEERLASPLLPAGSCRKWGCTEVARLLSRATDVPAWKQLLL